MQTTHKHKRRLFQSVALLTAGSTSWLVASPAIASATIESRLPKPLGHSRALTAGEMAHIFGARQTQAGGGGGTSLDTTLTSPDANGDSGSTEPWQGTTGSGVSTASGNKLTQHPIVAWTQRGGLPVAFTLSHSSIGQTNNSVGKKWTHSFNVYLNLCSGGGGIDPGGGRDFGYRAADKITFADAHAQTPISSSSSTVQLVLGDGRGETFTQNVDGSYSATAGIFDTLVKNANGTYTLTMKDLTVWSFCATGWLTSIADKNGNTLTLGYNTSNQVTTVTDATGRQLTLAWDATNKRINSATDPAGRVWNFAYDAAGNLASVTDPAAVSGGTRYVTGYAYDGDNRITQITDRRGKAWTYGYNTAGKISTEKTPLLHQTSYTYTSTGVSVTDPRDNAVVYTYNANGELTSVKDEANYTQSYSYNANHLKTGVTDKRSKAWAYSYDARGNVLSATNPLNQATSWTYNTKDEPLTETSPMGYATSLSYDAAGNLLAVTNPLGKATTYTIGTYGLVSQVTDATGKWVNYSYDANGNAVSVANPFGTTTASYTTLGWKTGTTDATSRTTSVVYDLLGRTTSATDANNRTTTFAYDAANHKVSQTDAAGKVNAYVYDDSGRVVSHTDPLNRVVSFGYDASGNKTTFTDGRGKVTTYAYTARNEMSGITYADGTGDAWNYSATGQQASKTDGRGVTTSYAYDDAGRLTNTLYPSGTASVAFAYDANGRKTGMTDGTGSTTYAYDNAGRMTSRTAPGGAVNYAYDDAGRVASRTLVGTGVTAYVYDTAGRTSSVTDSGDTIAYTYDNAGRMLTTTLPNGTVEGKSYTAGGELAKAETKKGAAVVSSFAYTYDSVGRKATETLANGSVVSFGYDAAGQLTSEARGGTGAYTIVYYYDNAGNRLASTRSQEGALGSPTNVDEQHCWYDDANKLTGTGEGELTPDKTYTYDAAGNTKTVTEGGQTTTLTWNAAGMMTGIAYPGGATNTFTYNGLMQRVGKTDSTGTFAYTLTDDSTDSAVLSDGAATYRQALGMLGEVRGGAKRYYNADSLGSTRTIADAAGAVSATKETDAFGNVWTPGTTGTQTPFGFAGQHGYQTDADSGLQKLGYRYYDASTGRFLSRDPIQDGYNWYTYCANDPVNAVDPTGLSLWRRFVKWVERVILRKSDDVVKKIDDVPYDAFDPKHRLDLSKPNDDVGQEIRDRVRAEDTERKRIADIKKNPQLRLPGSENWGREIGSAIDPTPVSDAIEIGEEAGEYASQWSDGERAALWNRRMSQF